MVIGFFDGEMVVRFMVDNINQRFEDNEVTFQDLIIWLCILIVQFSLYSQVFLI